MITCGCVCGCAFVRGVRVRVRVCVGACVSVCECVWAWGLCGVVWPVCGLCAGCARAVCWLFIRLCESCV